MGIQCWQRGLRELMHIRVFRLLVFLSEHFHGGLVVLDHVLQPRLIKGIAVLRLQILALFQCVRGGRGGERHLFALGQCFQLVVGLGVVIDDALRELLDLRIGRLFQRHLAQLHFSQTIGGGMLHERAVRGVGRTLCIYRPVGLGHRCASQTQKQCTAEHLANVLCGHVDPLR